jgi:hypothetical protein
MAVSLIKDQRDLASQMICRLDWRDFETLIDLIFAGEGGNDKARWAGIRPM